MSKLKITDLSFFETELSNGSEVQGGIGAYYQPVGSVSTSYDASSNAGYYGNWAVYKVGNGYVLSANVYGFGAGSAAGATAGAASDGTQFAASSAQASTY